MPPGVPDDEVMEAGAGQHERHAAQGNGTVADAVQAADAVVRPGLGAGPVLGRVAHRPQRLVVPAAALSDREIVPNAMQSHSANLDVPTPAHSPVQNTVQNQSKASNNTVTPRNEKHENKRKNPEKKKRQNSFELTCTFALLVFGAMTL